MSNYKEHAAMVDQLMKPGEAILQDLTPIKAERLHMAVGLVGEVGELVTNYVESDTTNRIDYINVLEELGDIEFYLEGLCQTYSLERLRPTAIFSKENGHPLALLSLVSAAGEVLDLVKKEAIYNKSAEHAGVGLQLLKLRVHLDSVYAEYSEQHIAPESAREANLQKLLKGDNARFKAGSYSNEAAQLRADKQQD